MSSCEHCIHYLDCRYYWKCDEGWEDCDDYVFDQYTLKTSDSGAV